MLTPRETQRLSLPRSSCCCCWCCVRTRVARSITFLTRERELMHHDVSQGHRRQRAPLAPSPGVERDRSRALVSCLSPSLSVVFSFSSRALASSASDCPPLIRRCNIIMREDSFKVRRRRCLLLPRRVLECVCVCVCVCVCARAVLVLCCAECLWAIPLPANVERNEVERKEEEKREAGAAAAKRLNRRPAFNSPFPPSTFSFRRRRRRRPPRDAAAACAQRGEGSE